MELYNTLAGKLEKFVPQNSHQATLYTCGPTVYDFSHIGNLRTYLFEDILKRTLKLAGFSVKHVMNITDVDDKTIEKSQADKIELSKITKQYEATFVADIKKLNIILPDKFTRATEYIGQMVNLIAALEKKGLAYKTPDGSIYFSISKFKDYGKLSKLDKKGIKSGARVNQDEYQKENPADFALWKAWDEADGDIYWLTSLGKGRPGWHIECSAMSQAELGETIDIHAGAVDLIFPHHENEIAQSEGASGKKFVRFWLHGEHLLVNGKRMAKSENNFYTLLDIVKKGFDPLDFRYLCLSAHYRDKLNFTWESLTGAKNARTRAIKILSSRPRPDRGSINSEYISKFKSALENDLNTPETLAVFWNLLRDEKIPAGDKKATALKMDEIFALDLDKVSTSEIPAGVQKLVDERKVARKEKNFELSDKLRGQIEELGCTVEDTDSGSKVYSK